MCFITGIGCFQVDLLLPSGACQTQELTAHLTSTEKVSRNISSVRMHMIQAHLNNMQHIFNKAKSFERNYHHYLFILNEFLCSEMSHHAFFPLQGEGEFNQRLERFKVPDSQASPASPLSQANHSPRPCSNFVSDIQQKLQCSTTPSSQQASRLREVGSGGLCNQKCLCASNHFFRLAFKMK